MKKDLISPPKAPNKRQNIKSRKYSNWWIGQEYELEKKVGRGGGDRKSDEFQKSSDQNDHLKSRDRIAQELNISPAKVQRARFGLYPHWRI